MPLGTYKEALSARSTDKKITDVSQDGGIVSALLCYALDEGIIEGAVVAGTPDEDWRPIPTVVTSADEVIAAAGTKYSMSPTLSAVKEATRQYGFRKSWCCSNSMSNPRFKKSTSLSIIKICC